MRLKMKEFASENAAPEGMWAKGGLIELLVVILVFSSFLTHIW